MRLPGAHNRFNAACAAASAWLLGAAPKAIEAALAAFPGLPDRIELVAETGGVRYYNDSIATTPESTMVALEAFREPIVLIAGGSSKNLSFEEVGRRIARRAKAVVLIGATAPEIERAIRAGAVTADARERGEQDSDPRSAASAVNPRLARRSIGEEPRGRRPAGPSHRAARRRGAPVAGVRQFRHVPQLRGARPEVPRGGPRPVTQPRWRTVQCEVPG